MKRSKRKILKNKLDKLWSEIIKVRADHECELCGNTMPLNSHHINGKRSDALRYDLSNGICLCGGHHTYGQVAAHSTSYEGQKAFHKKMEEKFPERIERAGSILQHKITDGELETMIEEYKLKLKEL